jgi:hypothetical protein
MAHKLCPDLKPKEICLVMEQYSEGKFNRLYHEHVPAHRLSDERRGYLLMSLVCRCAQMHPETIVRSYLNKRGSKPSADSSLKMDVIYPERGVLRTYCGGNVKAWSDQVVNPSLFRRQG